ncbi:hypothetical protein GGH91_001195 [Coemansia sp. RSA 2671]|uniref:Uncharacterized protein n=1 Tax=Coemansia linderi TaxID=2663919 RepID=A0ACC1KH11_9FUNG|nr:hypothetical protein LPJ60_003214 [Coemansia sp. RSA 2675]KAJ2014645.1 hypothetical protein IWW57_005831 [Coemansia sp. S610]KAJ2348776.1 hypothetical protein GGH91_001195 [Coemansia sp. RSA 2671]KAJ2410684.1 hypothetical protein GGI10_004494 [Coemansia sp. RSA 2530]KAJ2697481.1 hypothetical protein H4218_003909 [Coemansia sp. IMI 209128]KAJ2789829.1 hypothetical protein GGI18_002174 [Coemansia linderi]
MGYFVGLTAALAGNVVIGTGQCMQKSALNSLQRGGKASPRYKSPLWVLGLALNYAGEIFGNSLALSYLSAAVVAPLGIVSVIVNLLLAERFLGERVTPNQRFGFSVIMAGVGCILLVAPRKAAASSAAEFVEAVASSGILTLFTAMFFVQALFILLIRSGRQSLLLYVVVASMFGSMNVMASKLLTMFMRLRLTANAAAAPLPNPADIVFYGAKAASSSSGLSGAQVVAGVVMGLSIAGQESFRQQALGRYPVMEFQPVFFATFNVIATLSGLLLFRELDGWLHGAVFFGAFALGIGLIAYGSRFLPRARAVGLPSHIRLHKDNLHLDEYKMQ